jgi:elongation factor Tu
MRTADISVTVTLPEGVKMAMPGDNISTVMKLALPMPITKGSFFLEFKIARR